MSDSPAQPPDVEAGSDIAQPVWLEAPEDYVPGVVPVELILGRSARAVVLLTGVRAFPTGLVMTLSVRLRGQVAQFDLTSEVFDGPYRHGQDKQWQRERLDWGFEFSDGRRAMNVDPHPDLDSVPDHPTLIGGSGGGGELSADRDYWLWPLPPAGPIRVVCRWGLLGIAQAVQLVDANPIVAAAARAVPIWPESS